MKNIFTLLLFSHAIVLHGQLAYRIDQSIPVSAGQQQLTMPWTGGINAVQVNTMDIDFDGNADLILFDRTASKMITFLRKDNSYVYAPDYERSFPDEIANFVLLRDFDGDGRKDLFTGSVFGIRVFRNISDGTRLIWKPFLFHSGFTNSEVLLTKGLSGMINLQLQFDDLPSIGDADGDGDLDIFSMDFGGSGRVEFHKNFSVERYGHRDSLVFELVTKAWGGFAECDCAEFAFNNTDCGSVGGRVKHQGGKSLLAMDVNGDSRIDMLLSEAECDKLSVLINEGTLDAPVFTSSSLYPNPPAVFPYYPSPYIEDVDFDGINDLVVSPNLFSKPDLSVDFESSVWFFKNNGSNEYPQFNLATQRFLQSNMVDVGDNAVPALADIDGDGDHDLLISTSSFPSRIVMYENTGSRTLPSFRLVTGNYLNLSAEQFAGMKIQLVDANNDQRVDLVFTATKNGVPGLYRLVNKAADRLNFDGVVPEKLTFVFSASENIHMTDVNGDGRADILRGRNTGALEYWRNQGTSEFVLENPQYLDIGANSLRVNPIVSAADLDADGRPDLILTSPLGEIMVLLNYRSASSIDGAQTEILFDPKEQNLYSANLGGRIWPVAFDLYNVGRPAIVAGTTMGGILILKPEGADSTRPSLLLFPNPVRSSTETLNISADRSGSFEIVSMTGQRIREGVPVSPGVHEISLSFLARGLYVFRFQFGENIITHRVVVH